MQIESTIRDIQAVLTERFGEAPDGLHAGASEAKIAQLEQAIGTTVSEEVRSLLRLHDGESHRAETFLLGGRTWLLSSAEIAAEHRELCELARRSARLDVLDPGKVTAVGHVKPCYWNRRWVPFWTFDSPWAIDMDPPQGGRIGQVITVFWDDMEVRVEFGSLGEMFSSYLVALKSGERRFSAALRA
jgi:cell wall assembly regulator SMI1